MAKKPIRVANQTPQPFQAPVMNLGTDPYQSAYSMDQTMPSMVSQEMPGVPTGQRRIMKRGARRAGRRAGKPARGPKTPGMKPTGASIAF